MGKSAPKPPPPPNPYTTAAAQTASNKDTATAQGWIANANQVTPYGTVSYDAGNPVEGSGQYDTAGYTNALSQYNEALAAAIAGADGDKKRIAEIKKTNPAPLLSDFFTPKQTQFTQTVTLSPEEQAKLDQTRGLESQAMTGAGTALTNAQNAIAQPFSLSGLPETVSNVQGGDLKYGVDRSGLPQGVGNVGYGQIQDQINTSSVPGLSTDFNNLTQQAQNSIIQRNQPQIDRRRSQLENKLANQGITQGSEAWREAQDDLARQENDFNLGAIQAGNALQNQLFGQSALANQQIFGQQQNLGQFANQAQQQGFSQAGINAELANALRSQLYGENATDANLFNQAQGQQFSQDSNNAALQNAARQQGITERAYERSQPINEFATLFGLGGQVQGPNQSPFQAPSLQNTDISGLIGQNYQNQLNQYSNQVANRNAQMGGLGSLLGTGVQAYTAFSDRRLKENIEPIGQENGHNIYEFNYIGDDKRYIGVMADEVPEASVMMPNGFYAVDYSKIGVQFREAN